MTDKENAAKRLYTSFPLYFSGVSRKLAVFSIEDQHGTRLIAWINGVYDQLITQHLITLSRKSGSPDMVWKLIDVATRDLINYTVSLHEGYVDMSFLQCMGMACFLVILQEDTGIPYNEINLAFLVNEADGAYTGPQLIAMTKDISHIHFQHSEPDTILVENGHYVGEQLNGKRSLTDSFENQIEGEWMNGKLVYAHIQYGRLEPRSYLRTYQGHFNDAGLEQDEHAIVTYQNGDRYEGSWNQVSGADERLGKGIYYYKDGRQMEGFWSGNSATGIMHNTSVAGEIKPDGVFLPYVKKPLEWGVVLPPIHMHSFFSMFSSLPNLMVEHAYPADWLDRNPLPDNLCRGEIEHYMTDTLIEDRCDMIVYAYDTNPTGKKSIRGLATISIRPDEDHFLEIHSFCSQRHTTKIGTMMMLMIQQWVALHYLETNRIRPLSIILDSILLPSTLSFYKKMGFVKNRSRFAPDDLEAMIWTISSRGQAERITSLPISMESNFARGCEGTRSRKRRTNRNHRKTNRR